MHKFAENSLDLSLEVLSPRDKNSVRAKRPEIYALTEKEKKTFRTAYNECSRRLKKSDQTLRALDRGQLGSVFVGLSLCLRNGYMPLRVTKFSDLKKSSVIDKISKWQSKKDRNHAVAISYLNDAGECVVLYPNSRGWRVITSSPDMNAADAKFNSSQLSEHGASKHFKAALKSAKDSLHIMPLGRLSSEPLSWSQIQSFLTMLALETLPSTTLHLEELTLGSERGKPDFHAILSGSNVQVNLQGNGSVRNFDAIATRMDGIYSQTEADYMSHGFNVITAGTAIAGLSYHLRHAAHLRSDQIRALLSTHDKVSDTGPNETQIKLSRRIMMTNDILKFVDGINALENEVAEDANNNLARFAFTGSK